MLECVVNVSEGLDPRVLRLLRAASGADLLDVHVDPHHHRSVWTLLGEEAPRRLASVAVAEIDMARHRGVHPRIGAVDVVPFVALEGSEPGAARDAADEFAAWIAATHGVAVYRYGSGGHPDLPEVRRRARSGRTPDLGSAEGNPRAGAVAVGSRPPLVAFNGWTAAPDLDRARLAARAVRREAFERWGDGSIRTLALRVGGRVQVSMNLVKPLQLGPADAADLVGRHVATAGYELVGLLPEQVLRAVPPHRWDELDLSMTRTIEARISTVTGRR